MDDDEMQQTLEIRDFEIERRLEAFARARLSPNPVAAARTRARVMREARLQFDAARIAAQIAPAVALSTRRSSPRRFLTPLLAASMWVGIAVGYATEHLLTFGLRMSQAGLSKEQSSDLTRTISERLAALPGVSSVFGPIT